MGQHAGFCVCVVECGSSTSVPSKAVSGSSSTVLCESGHPSNGVSLPHASMCDD